MGIRGRLAKAASRDRRASSAPTVVASSAAEAQELLELARLKH